MQVKLLLAGEVTLPKGDGARAKTIREFEEIVRGLRIVNSSFVHVNPPIAISFTFPMQHPAMPCGRPKSQGLMGMLSKCCVSLAVLEHCIKTLLYIAGLGLFVA